MLPFLLKPYLKKVIWGGSRLSDFKGLNSQLDHIGESWEVSAMPGCESIVASGEYKGHLLSELCHRFGAELLGENIFKQFGSELPLLVKFIDTADDLSIQVHPDDKIARNRHNCSGKYEMWYIVDAKPGAKLATGFNTDISEEEFRRRVADGSFMDVLTYHDAKAGDVFYLPPGRVHAIGKGILLVEVQQASDVTYRIFDYNRRDADGCLRELHVDNAIDAIDYSAVDECRFHPEGTEIAQTQHFKVERLRLNDSSNCKIENSSFTIITCIDGAAKAKTAEGEIEIVRGYSMMIPALTATTFTGDATLLIITP